MLKIEEFRMNVGPIKGFYATGIFAGIKSTGRKDMCLIYSQKDCVAAGVFTKNLFKAAPVLVSMEILSRNPTGIRGIIANSGNANCLTGQRGIEDAKRMVELTQKNLGLPENSILVASTGIIGKNLPMSAVEYGINKLSERIKHENNLNYAAEAIMTTDTKPKLYSVRGILDGVPFNIVGIAKGSGMINPSMATMLCFIMTDVKISQDLLREALLQAVDESFNVISVDGDMSTNDTVFILSNSDSEFSVEGRGERYDAFLKALKKVTFNLAMAIIEDGEDPTKIVKIRVSSSSSRKKAEIIARKVANSLLVKTMLFGQNPNWGRILAAIGSTLENVNISKLHVSINGLDIFKNGEYVGVFDNSPLLGRNVSIDIDLGQGKEEFVMYTNDLSYDYVKINAEYS